MVRGVDAMDLSSYIELNSKGLMRVIKVGKNYAIERRQFNSNTGEEILPQIKGTSFEEIQELRNNVMAQLNNLDALLADMTAKGE